MKTILYTGFDPSYFPLAKLTIPLMGDYADKHGMEMAVFTAPPEGLNIYWTGIARGLQLLEDYDRILYLDCDQMITNPDRPPNFDPSYGFWCSRDWGSDAVERWHFSACGWVAHSDCIPMLKAVLEMEPEWRGKPFQEQGPWREWMQTKSPGNLYININPRRLFNAVPDQVCPGQVPEPWQPGDFAAHLTMVGLERRVEIFHELQKLIG